jgi:hypothetical protein
MTSGVPKKSRTCGQADGTLIDGFLDCGNELARQQVRRIRRAKVPAPVHGVRRSGFAETFAFFGVTDD